MKREKRIAAFISIFFHVILFIILSTCGLFAYLQHREEMPIDVVVYDEDTSKEAAGQGSSNDSDLAGAADAGGDTMEMPSIDKLPPISETYTQQVAVEREIKRVEQEKHVNRNEAEQIVNEAAAQSGKNTNGQDSHGKLNADGRDPNGVANVSAAGHHEENKREAQAAVCVFKPNPRDYQPAVLREKNINGIAVVAIEISSDGSVNSSSIISSSGNAELDSTALVVASRYRFRPALNGNGEPVNSLGQITVTF